MVNSMTGFATLSGHSESRDWVWEIRSVNGRGLDVRVRVPDGCEGLERQIKADISKVCIRGTINVGLRTRRATSAGQVCLNHEALAIVVEAAKAAGKLADLEYLHLGPTNAADLLALRGVLDVGETSDDIADWLVELNKELPTVVNEFLTSRGAEGRALEAILGEQVTRIEALSSEAAVLAEKRKDVVAENLKANVVKLLDAADDLDEGRIAQELALLAVKADVTEELDRIAAHVTAARDLLANKGPIGRKLDFLMQEFNREVNTLCSKSGAADLTQVGLDLKVVIDQMREQTQNVE